MKKEISQEAAYELLEACKLALKVCKEYKVSEYTRLTLQQAIRKAEGDV